MTDGARPPLSSESVVLSDESQIGEARRAVAALCRRLGLGETEAGQASIAATEAAANVIRHGGGGELLMRALGPKGGLELVALDRGPGIADVARALEDGFSTAGSSGTGLGAMRRLSSVFELWTAPAQGTAVLMRMAGATLSTATIVGAVCLPHPGEQECGDVWDFESRPSGYRLVIADGLGHGPMAREAALRAVEGAGRGLESPSRALEEAHRSALGSRGAAMAVADVDLAAGTVRYAGVGNIAGVLMDGSRNRNMVSMSGTVGQGPPRLREFTYPLEQDTALVMYSDGLGTHWSLERQPGLIARHPALLAGVLYRDYSRRRDDVTVVAVRRSAS
jgi:anti-sigma regulatory factor (Ser/Thr protein kinase)